MRRSLSSAALPFDYSSMGDVIDRDGSGFIAVHEINRFMSKSHVDWQAPKILAL